MKVEKSAGKENGKESRREAQVIIKKENGDIQEGLRTACHREVLIGAGQGISCNNCILFI